MFLKFQGSLIRYDFCSIFKVPVRSFAALCAARNSFAQFLKCVAFELVRSICSYRKWYDCIPFFQGSADIISHSNSFVNTFFEFFQKIFSTPFEVFVRLFRWNSFIISLIFPFVNTFLQLFSVLAVATIIHRNSYSPLSKNIQNWFCLDVTWMDTVRSGGIEIAA